MKVKQVTQWFIKGKPVHVGLYQRYIGGHTYLSHWDGYRFGMISKTASIAVEQRVRASVHQTEPWRGVAK